MLALKMEMLLLLLEAWRVLRELGRICLLHLVTLELRLGHELLLRVGHWQLRLPHWRLLLRDHCLLGLLTVVACEVVVVDVEVVIDWLVHRLGL